MSRSGTAGLDERASGRAAPRAPASERPVAMKSSHLWQRGYYLLASPWLRCPHETGRHSQYRHGLTLVVECQ